MSGYLTGCVRRVSVPGASWTRKATGRVVARSPHLPLGGPGMSFIFDREPAYLLLEDGRRFDGVRVGRGEEAVGEVVFNTSMTGYQEILTDPSYTGQIVVMTVPLVGNYGVNAQDQESPAPRVSGFVVREMARTPSSWRASGSLEEYLDRHGVNALTEVDTRALTRHLRSAGAMRGAIAAAETPEADLLERIRRHPPMEGLDLAHEAGLGETYDVTPSGPERFQVLAFDFGIKNHSPKLMAERGCRVTVLPPDSLTEGVVDDRVDGIFISNGPGDPAAVSGVVEALSEMARRGIPILGICLGHQLVARAFGGRTYKLPFGHHGANHPVQNLHRGFVEITSQNHGFAVEEEEGAVAGAPELRVTHRNLYDGTVEGLAHSNLPVFAVQYHPEAAPGPHDSRYLFDDFIREMEGVSGNAV